MNAAILAILGIGAFVLGYWLYSRLIAKRIYALDPDFKTPAYTMQDGVWVPYI